MYAIVLNNEIVQYPANPRVDNPFVSFPDNWGGGEINDIEYVVVSSSTPPSINLGWSYTESTPVQSNSSWQQSWTTSLKPKESIKYDITNKRYEVEVGGVVISNNTYATDRESQTKYVAVAVDISQQINVNAWSITWKTNDNQFVNLNANQMLQVISGVRQHVQNCYDKEAEYYQLIDAANTSTLQSTDFSAGWTSNS
jgi:hypothetical protein